MSSAQHHNMGKVKKENIEIHSIQYNTNATAAAIHLPPATHTNTDAIAQIYLYPPSSYGRIHLGIAHNDKGTYTQRVQHTMQHYTYTNTHTVPHQCQMAVSSVFATSLVCIGVGLFVSSLVRFCAPCALSSVLSSCVCCCYYCSWLTSPSPNRIVYISIL